MHPSVYARGFYRQQVNKQNNVSTASSHTTKWSLYSLWVKEHKKPPGMGAREAQQSWTGTDALSSPPDMFERALTNIFLFNFPPKNFKNKKIYIIITTSVRNFGFMNHRPWARPPRFALWWPASALCASRWLEASERFDHDGKPQPVSPGLRRGVRVWHTVSVTVLLTGKCS